MVNTTFMVLGGPNQIMCSPINVLLDHRIENVEQFTLELSTDDPMVIPSAPEANVFIFDSDSKTIPVNIIIICCIYLNCCSSGC